MIFNSENIGETKNEITNKNIYEKRMEFDPDKRIEVQSDKKESISAEFDPDRKIGEEMHNNEGSDTKNEKSILENNNKLGGSHKDVYVPGEGEKIEVNHMPANEATDLAFRDGPAIKMDKEDHRKTASWGASKEAQLYRAKQKELVDKGEFRKAIQMDIDDIREKFGDKYDEAIDQMLDYVDQLEKEGKV